MPLQFWKGSPRQIKFDKAGIREVINNTSEPCFIVKDLTGRVGATNVGLLSTEGPGLSVLAVVPPCPAESLGDAGFRKDYKLKYNYKTGAMANGIASEDLVIAVGQAGLLGSFGAAGLVPDRIMKAISKIKSNLGDKSFAFNLIHSPNEEALEAGAVDLFLKHGIHIVEASAYLGLTKHIVYYRVAGLRRNKEGKVVSDNKVIAKISRVEVARQFMLPAPDHLLQTLVDEKKITLEQASLAKEIPMADDLTVEADSGGHTDNRPLVVLLPLILQLKRELAVEHPLVSRIRIGAAGGIGTPTAALSAFMMGAAYIVTGSINQACVESGTSDTVRKLLAQVSSTDVMMAPASDMFEMGVELQVLKRGTLFGPKAKKLYHYYIQYEDIYDIPATERQKMEKTIFKKSIEEVWDDCVKFFTERDPEQIHRAENNPKRKMALIFRWYLGLSSNWANAGTPDRIADYQIWCGPAMGGFNQWVKGGSLEAPENRKAAVVAYKLMEETAQLYRLQALKIQGYDWELLPATVSKSVVHA